MKKEFSLSLYLEDKRKLINNTLLDIIFLLDEERELISAIKYSLMANGKRLRPVLSIAAFECIEHIEKTDKKDEDFSKLILIPACAIEMIHTYSLIHDDLPAMDDDDLRRGKPTLHKKYSEASAILAGDALLTHAFFILSNPDLLKSKKSLNNDILIKIISIISNAAGINGMVEGQMLDMQSLNKDNSDSLEYLKKMHSLKTGKMIQASVKIGAIAGGASLEEINMLDKYAENIGLAFQIVDDILDIEGDASIIGKPVGSDVANNKMTFPGIIGLEQSKKYAKDLIDDAIAKLKIFGHQALPLHEIANYIIKRNY